MMGCYIKMKVQFIFKNSDKIQAYKKIGIKFFFSENKKNWKSNSPTLVVVGKARPIFYPVDI